MTGKGILTAAVKRCRSCSSDSCEGPGIMQRLKVLLCLQLHPNNLSVSTPQPSLLTAKKTQNKTLEQLWCTNEGKEWNKLVLQSLLASKAFFTEPPKEKTPTEPNKDALRILGCNKLHSKEVLITLIPQEELLPRWNWCWARQICFTCTEQHFHLLLQGVGKQPPRGGWQRCFHSLN